MLRALAPTSALIALVLPVAGQEILQTLLGKHAGDRFGYALALGGDVGGDGIEDLIVGAPCNTFFGTVYDKHGYVQVYDHHGQLVVDLKSTGIDGGSYGASVARGPDLDSDGRSDLLIGEPRYGTWTEGRVLIQSSATQEILYEKSGAWSYAVVGSFVAALGDVDADGIEDFACTAHEQFSGDGPSTLDVISGATTLPLYHLEDFASSADFLQVAGIGDIDGDGHADFASGQPYLDHGLVRVRSGADGSILFEHTDPVPDNAFGTAVAAAGDLDLDGVPDFVVGADDHAGPPSSPTLYGSVRAISGSDGSTLWKVLGKGDGGIVGDLLGTGLDGGRDVDLDGVPDVLAAGESLIEVRSGWDGARLFRHELSGQADLGFGLCFLPDWNGDLRPDFAVAAPGQPANATGFVLAFALLDKDCDADGLLDYVALANELAPDCNYNHAPDACDVASGASPDADQDGVPDECQTPLAGFPAAVSLLTGGVHDLTVAVGPQPATTWYLVLGSLGTSPGLHAGAFVLPLNPDAWFIHTLNHVNEGPLVASFGLLDANGVATAPAIEVPYGLDPALAGLTLYHAALLLQDATWTPTGVTNAVPLALVP